MRLFLLGSSVLLAFGCAPTLDQSVEETTGLSAQAAAIKAQRADVPIRLETPVTVAVRPIGSGPVASHGNDTGDTGGGWDTGGGDTGGGDTGGGDTGGGDGGDVEGGEVNCLEQSGYESTPCSVGGQQCTCSGPVVCERVGDDCQCALTVEDIDCGDTGDTGDTGIFQTVGG